ncbi:transcriptional regulator, GntR family [Paracoccus halophilus]|uniref:GntR family transcriptional regulator n=1 Tax=Paracoccus halophilus TaxID=376733 RepID=A0A099EWC4_9RHOB|nr:GntR family transcriptional regulator [Paracoccus halophilus]KGJ02253.1 GntR family transcriptional regulator [Paracoccus halophilus]SFA61670.1 transcriptional regulator, GntR family [Paracoccus halophilus]
MAKKAAGAIQSGAANVDRKQLLADALRQRILTMEIAPGAVIDEQELAEEFGLSRPPVRELMRQMAGEGYIELEANRPARATPMGHHVLRDFYLVAPLIYVATTRLAAESARPVDIARLRAVQTEFRAAIEQGDINARIFANDDFHLEIGKIARNVYLMPSLRRVLIDHARVARTYYRDDVSDREELATAAAQHDQIIDAIERRDPETAGRIVQAHMELSRRNMAAYAVPEGMEMPPGL